MLRLAPLVRRVATPRPVLITRTLTTSLAVRSSDFSFNRPGPPPLPAADQAEFEALVKAAEVAPSIDEITPETLEEIKAVEHRDLRKGAKPEFEGDTNPKTGEVGGPKRDPFMAGDSDWQFGGRVTVSLTVPDDS
ncbi:putative mitochondrial protein, conserved [Apiotrichum porosum]|uniref:Succinate dehydrogenase assembly factor 4, mitochondrial n=1 Tax=Apiotrichum porosum TaxID=105984 RepID=A0A427Y6B1_9TREE|nr:putative mitochondrial protein, conserved [Apiotrichum porosum]RSH86629.1 putative mitochondrial protein, conserved [Apiotrichum porosum]